MDYIIDTIKYVNIHGSLIGLLLLFYGNAVSGFSFRRMRHHPFDLSGVENSKFGSITTTISGPTNIWVIVYLIALFGIIKGLLIWFVVGVSTLLILRFLFLYKIIGVHLILAFFSLVVGTVLTILKNPF